MTTPTARREITHYACERGLSQRQACALMGLARGNYAPPAGGGRGGIQPADADIIDRLQALVKRHSGWGFWKYHYRLRKLGVLVNQLVGVVAGLVNFKLSHYLIQSTSFQSY